LNHGYTQNATRDASDRASYELLELRALIIENTTEEFVGKSDTFVTGREQKSCEQNSNQEFDQYAAYINRRGY
jgi:hypothetical protein